MMTGMYYYSAVCHLIIYSDIIYENDIHNVKEFIFMRILIYIPLIVCRHLNSLHVRRKFHLMNYCELDDRDILQTIPIRFN